MPLALASGRVDPENVKMGKRALGCFLRKSRTKWHPNGGQRGVKGGSKGGLLQKYADVSPISEMRLMKGETWHWGLGTGGGMSGSSDAAAYADGCGRALAYILQAGRPRVNPVLLHEAEDRR